jgi:predicted transposase YbfD/YdcC
MQPQLLDPRPYFADLPDPRRETQNTLHKLHDILMIVLCAVLSGVEDWAGMADFAEDKEAWLRGFLELPNGIPSHDTLSDVLGRIDPTAFQAAFSAWSTAAQQAVAETSNAITAVPDLLALLDLQGAMVSIDAMGCQKAIAQAIVDAGGDYVLTLKDNPPTLCENVRLWLDTEVACGRLPVLETVEKDHGRIEIRRDALGDRIDWLEAKLDWAGLQAVGRVESTRIIGDQTSTECRYFLCSFPQRDRFATTVRSPWGIENQQHWILDVQFGEDACRTRKDHSAANRALMRRMALNLLRHNGLQIMKIRFPSSPQPIFIIQSIIQSIIKKSVVVYWKEQVKLY